MLSFCFEYSKKNKMQPIDYEYDGTPIYFDQVSGASVSFGKGLNAARLEILQTDLARKAGIPCNDWATEAKYRVAKLLLASEQ